MQVTTQRARPGWQGKAKLRMTLAATKEIAMVSGWKEPGIAL